MAEGIKGAIGDVLHHPRAGGARAGRVLTGFIGPKPTRADYAAAGQSVRNGGRRLVNGIRSRARIGEQVFKHVATALRGTADTIQDGIDSKHGVLVTAVGTAIGATAEAGKLAFRVLDDTVNLALSGKTGAEVTEAVMQQKAVRRERRAASRAAFRARLPFARQPKVEVEQEAA